VLDFSRALAMGAHPEAVVASCFGLRLRPLLTATFVVALVVLLYFLVLAFIVAGALSRLSTVHNSAAEYSVSIASSRAEIAVYF
jgi:hypothetical protein